MEKEEEKKKKKSVAKLRVDCCNSRSSDCICEDGNETFV
jgi:hypothetical protein